MSKRTKTPQSSTPAPSPRTDAGLAHKAFMSMPASEWSGLFKSVGPMGIGLQPEEQKGYLKALMTRGAPKVPPSKEDHEGMSKTAAVGATVNRVAKSSAIVIQGKVDGLAATFPQALTQAKDHFGAAFQALVTLAAMKDLSPVQLGEAFTYAKDLEDTLSEAASLIKARVKELALREGTPSGEKGLSRHLSLGNGTYVPVTIQKSGLDPKKFEALVRAKDQNPADYMDTKISFVLKDGMESADLAVTRGIMTQDEVKTCLHELSYRVDRPKAEKE